MNYRVLEKGEHGGVSLDVSVGLGAVVAGTSAGLQMMLLKVFRTLLS